MRKKEKRVEERRKARTMSRLRLIQLHNLRPIREVHDDLKGRNDFRKHFTMRFLSSFHPFCIICQ